MRQDLAPDEFEIIVVDNASDDETLRLLEEQARVSPAHFVGVRMNRDCGPAVARNVGITLAEGDVVAFTDSDCVPTSGWLRACLAGFSNGTGVVQGRTSPPPDQAQPLFNHFIETPQFDGSFSTSNVAYLREALIDAGGFDNACAYWEDTDLGWRASRLGWQSSFSRDALVYHQVLPRSGIQWLLHPRHFHNWPAKAARYPEFRRHLFLGIWAHPTHAIFQLFLLGLVLGRVRPKLWLLTLPYLAMFPSQGRLVGRFPILRAAAHVARDAVATAALIAGSVRYRSVVL
jgi:GT2 family glycosyltransferase